MATRILLGKRGSEYGLWTTLAGYDAASDDATDFTKFSFSSSWSWIGRILESGRAEVPGTVTYRRTYSFIPFVLWRPLKGSIPSTEVGGDVTTGVIRTQYTAETWHVQNAHGTNAIAYDAGSNIKINMTASGFSASTKYDSYTIQYITIAVPAG